MKFLRCFTLKWNWRSEKIVMLPITYCGYSSADSIHKQARRFPSTPGPVSSRPHNHEATKTWRDQPQEAGAWVPTAPCPHSGVQALGTDRDLPQPRYDPTGLTGAGKSYLTDATLTHTNTHVHRNTKQQSIQTTPQSTEMLYSCSLLTGLSNIHFKMSVITAKH